MTGVLGIVYRAIATHLIHKAGYTNQTADTGAVTLIQRFGSALNLNIHFHMLFLDGVYVNGATARFHRVADDDPLSVLQGHSISYRIALGPQAGRKVFTLQTLPPVDSDEMHSGTVGQVAGFNLHAGFATRADQRRKLERLCRYFTRPAVSEQRLSLTTQGKVRYQLKTPYRDGTTHVIFEPLDFISKLAALVPKPRINLTRYHCVFAPNSQHRALVTPARRGRGNKAKAPGPEDATPVASHAAMSWAQRLKRVFDIETCSVCGGSMKVIACIEDPVVIKKILTHLRSKGLYLEAAGLPPSRAPPQDDLFS
jgi:hypothetical protein